MRYGSMTMKKGMLELVDKGVDEILLFPLYPQFAMATTETILVLAENIQKEHFPNLTLDSVPAFYNKPDYIEVLSNSIAKHLKCVEYDHLLFSYHGVPERHIRKRDVTKHQCKEVTRLVAEKLKMKEGSYSTSFQSRLGFDPWLQPYTDRTIERLGKQGIKNMAIVTPAFVSDCLETLEEIAMEGQEIFHEMGGQQFSTIPCLNDDEEWVLLLSKWINEWSKIAVILE
ncbi:UNVERIFIED_CONTAM: hypothetical protein GTU68_042450 [Idotea baltica]|nr:hypothetical protein [Idotea baltica]